jgi:hypothetical protein
MSVWIHRIHTMVCVGEFRKNLSPSKCRVWRDSWNELWLNIVKIWNLEPAKPRSREPVKIWNLEPAKPWSREPVKVWNLEPAKPWSHERKKIWNPESTKFWNRESVKFGNLLKIKFGGHGAWGFLWIKDSWISKKPSQRRCLKSPGLTCELVAGL